MTKICSVVGAVLAVLFAISTAAHGASISYTANLHTSKGNPVYDILILETDSAGQVHASLYPTELPGRGLAVISHDLPFTPVKTLVIGLTEGKDTDGSDKTQIVMFLDGAFAAAHAGIPFSSIFSGARHSETIANLKAAVGGDAERLSWFTDTFFPGPAAGAAFDSSGPFTVAEFTSLTIIGANGVAGQWMINSSDTIPFNDPDALSGFATEVIDETAKLNNGPFDIAFTLSEAGVFAVDKTVLNNTGVPWRRFVMQLGTGMGATFTPSTTGDGLFFISQQNNHEETGAFPDVTVEEDRVIFSGFLAPGGTAHFIVFVRTNDDTQHTVTLRQSAVGVAAVGAPLLRPWALAVLILVLMFVASTRILRSQPGRRLP